MHSLKESELWTHVFQVRLQMNAGVCRVQPQSSITTLIRQYVNLMSIDLSIKINYWTSLCFPWWHLFWTYIGCCFGYTLHCLLTFRVICQSQCLCCWLLVNTDPLIGFCLILHTLLTPPLCVDSLSVFVSTHQHVSVLLYIQFGLYWTDFPFTSSPFFPVPFSMVWWWLISIGNEMLHLPHKVIVYQNNITLGFEEIKSIRLTGLVSKCSGWSFGVTVRMRYAHKINKSCAYLNKVQSKSTYSITTTEGQLKTDGNCKL